VWRHRDILIKGWPYTKGHRLKLVGMGVTTVLMALLPLIQPWPVALLIDSVVGEKAYPDWLSWLTDASPLAQILLAIGLMLAVDLLSHGIGIWAQWLEVRFELTVVRDFRSALFRHTQQLSLSYLDRQRAGQFIYYINFQAHSLGSLITTVLPLTQMLITVVGALVITWLISPTLAVIAMATIPFIVLSTTLYNRYVEPTLVRVRNLEGGSMGIVHESVAMMRVVVAFCREQLEYRVFRNNAERSIAARTHLTMRQTLFVALVSMISALGTAAAVGYSAWLIMNGNTSVGSLIVVMSYMTRVYQPLEQLSTTIASIQEQFVNIRISFDLLEVPIQITEKPGAPALPPARGDVRFEDVTFTYPGGRRPAVEHVSFHARPGQKVALVGPTGAGKSTLVHLIPRFEDPTGGVVRIDGHDLRDVTIESVRSQIAVVSQEPLLFGRTIEENIRYARLDATRDEVVEAARAANAHEFIVNLPDGYDTKLAERGGGLSGGEKQRLTIARAFLKDAPILILDEPTSSIDSRTESAILDALDRLSEGRTTFVVAHRLSTVADADVILVMEGAHLVQQGTHDELLAAGGLYREMWEAQTGVRTNRAPGAAPCPPPFRGVVAHPATAATEAREALELAHWEAEAIASAAVLTEADVAASSMDPAAGDRVVVDLDGSVTVVHANGDRP
jgi:ABC-type multidrug transport system fused ATPase/permease subunit